MGSLYSEQRTWLHAVAAVVKLVCLALLGTGLFMTEQVPALLGACVVCVAVFASLGRVVAPTLPLLWGLAVAGVLVAAFHGLNQQPLLAVVALARMVSLTLMGMAYTLTTRYSDTLHVLTCALMPLQRLGVRTDRVALQLALMLRFIEHFFVLWRRLDDAHRVRTGQAGGFKILAPLTLHMLMAARRVADALHVRLRR